MTQPVQPVGVYVLANDAVADWAIAFLESFRAHNPDLPLVLIPYDDRMEQVAALRDTYGFDILSDPALKSLDEVGWSFADDPATGWVPMFRKLAAFWGPFEHSIYLDCDIVVLDKLDELLEAFASSDLDFCFFDETEEHIYTSEDLRRRMQREYAARLFNAGYWCARKGTLALEEVRRLRDEALPLRDEFYKGMDQPFINYCVHRTGLRHGALSDLIPDLAHHHWAARWRRIRPTGTDYRVGHEDSPDYGKRVKLLHWAGHPISPLMPYRKLFERYRLASMTASARRAYRAVAWRTYWLHQVWHDARIALHRLKNRLKGTTAAPM